MVRIRQSAVYSATRAEPHGFAVLVGLLMFFVLICPSLFGEDLISGHPIMRTYGGDLVIRFPNYDLQLVGPASRQFGLNSSRSNNAPLVFRDEKGTYWDGSRAFLSPNYPYALIRKDRFSLNFINQTDIDRPPEPTAFPPPETIAIQGAGHLPAITYRPLPDDAILKMGEFDARGTLKLSQLPADAPSFVKQKFSLPAVPQTRPTATIIVRPFTPQPDPPPAHDSLGVFLQR